jgi:hypothetical protein
MVKSSLNDGLIESGKLLVQQLDDGKVNVAAAFWLLLPEEGFWKLMIALADHEVKGSRAGYARVQKALSRIQERGELSLGDVSLLKPTAPLLKSLRAGLRKGCRADGARLTNEVIKGQLISDAYIYRLH